MFFLNYLKILNNTQKMFGKQLLFQLFSKKEKNFVPSSFLAKKEAKFFSGSFVFFFIITNGIFDFTNTIKQIIFEGLILIDIDRLVEHRFVFRDR